MKKETSTKEYLSQVFYLDRQIEAKIEQRDHLKSLAFNISPSVGKERVKGGPLENKTEEYICKWVDLEKEMNEDIDSLVNLRRTIQSQIEQVKDEKHKLLLTLRYLNFRTWEKIADDMCYTYRNIHYVHDKAIKEFESLHSFSQKTVA